MLFCSSKFIVTAIYMYMYTRDKIELGKGIFWENKI